MDPRFLEHAREPQRVGTLDTPTHTSRTTENVCGDELELHVHIHAGLITDAAFRVRGCSGAIALGSVLCSVLIGRSQDACSRAEIESAIEAAVGAVPPAKRHALRLITRATEACLG